MDSLKNHIDECQVFSRAKEAIRDIPVHKRTHAIGYRSLFQPRDRPRGTIQPIRNPNVSPPASQADEEFVIEHKGYCLA